MGDENEEDYTEPTAGGAPVASGPLYGPGGVAVPGPTKTTVGPKKTTVSVQPNAGYMQSIGQQQEAGDAEIEALDYGANVAGNVATAQKGVYDTALQAEKAKIKARADASAEWNKRITAEQAKLDSRIQQASADPTDYWADRTEGEKTMARIGVWLSAFGAAITGGDNLALKTINEAIERDLRAKQAKADRLLKLAETSRGLLADAYRNKAQELGDIDAQRVAAWNVVEKQMESTKMGFLPAEKRAEADLKIAQVQEKKAQALQEANEKLASRVTNEDQYESTTLPAAGQPKVAPLYDPQTGGETGVTSAGTAKELNEKSAKAMRLIDVLKEAREIENESVAGFIPGRMLPIGEISHRREQNAKEVALAAKDYYGSGLGRGLPKETQKLLEEVTGAGAEAHLRNRSDEIDRAIMLLGRDVATAYKARGVAQYTPKFARGGGGGKSGAREQKQPRAAASDPASDYAFVLQRVDKLDQQRTNAFDEAVELLKSEDPKMRAKAARGLKILRDELPKD